LAHKFGTKVTRAYDRDDEIDNRRALMTAWAGYIGPSGPRRLVASQVA